MKNVTLLFTLCCFFFVLNTQEATAQMHQNLKFEDGPCNCSDQNKKKIKRIVLSEIPKSLHRKINFKKLYHTGKLKIKGKKIRQNFTSNSGGGTKAKECESQTHKGLDANGNPNTCKTTICHYTAINEWTIHSQCWTTK